MLTAICAHVSVLTKRARQGLRWWLSGKEENLPASAGNVGLIPDLGRKIPHVLEQLSPCATTTEPNY